MSEHTILVAFTVEAPTRGQAHDELMQYMPLVDYSPITSWWVAEDDRQDRSDNDSAVFVRPGTQQEAVRQLHAAGLTDECNLSMGHNIREEWIDR